MHFPARGVFPKNDSSGREQSTEDVETNEPGWSDETTNTAWRVAIKNFTPQWFIISMNTGILGIIMARLPYRFAGLEQLTDVAYVINIIIFTVFSIATLLRFALFRKATLQTLSDDPEELCFLATIPVAWLTLAAVTADQVTSTRWGGYPFTLVAYAMWWFGAGWSVILCFGINIAIYQRHPAQTPLIPTSIFLTMVGVSTAGTTAATICNYAEGLSARLAVPVIIVGFFLCGIAIFVACNTYAIFSIGILTHGWPEPAKLPGLCLLAYVGPLGQSAAAMQLLGTAAHGKGFFEDYGRGSFLQGSSAAGIDAASTLIALLVMGFEYYWVVLALTALVQAARKRKLTYTLTWWSTIYPFGTVDVAWLVLGNKMDSPAFDVLTTALFLILLLDYFINCVFTIRGCLYGTLLVDRTKSESNGSKEN